MKATQHPLRHLLYLTVLLVVPLLCIGASDKDDSKKTRPAPQGAKQEVGAELPEFGVPKAWKDAAFNQYVNLQLLDRAIDQQNAELMTDVALQFAEGERVLLRPHKAISADKLFAMATAIASDKQDKKALARLGKAADANGNQQLKKLLATAELSGATRAPEPEVMVDSGQVAPETISYYNLLKEQIVKWSTIVPSRTELQKLKNELPKTKEIVGLTDSQMKDLQARLDTALENVKEDDPAAAALDLLSVGRSTNSIYGYWEDRDDSLTLDRRGFEWEDDYEIARGVWRYEGGTRGTIWLEGQPTCQYEISWDRQEGAWFLEIWNRRAGIDAYYWKY